jgi:hypothetical protein
LFFHKKETCQGAKDQNYRATNGSFLQALLLLPRPVFTDILEKKNAKRQFP